MGQKEEGEENQKVLRRVGVLDDGRMHTKATECDLGGGVGREYTL